MQMTKRKSRKERVMGGMIMGIRREMMEKGTKMETEMEGLMVEMVKRGEEKWRIVGESICRQGKDEKDVAGIKEMNRK